MLMTYLYFLTSLNYALKLLVESLFFNEIELCDNIARQSYDKNVSSKMPFCMELTPFEALPRILSLCELRNNQPYGIKGLEFQKI